MEMKGMNKNSLKIKTFLSPIKLKGVSLMFSIYKLRQLVCIGWQKFELNFLIKNIPRHEQLIFTASQFDQWPALIKTPAFFSVDFVIFSFASHLVQ